MIYTVYSHDFTINTGDFTITNLECSSTNHWTNMVVYATKLWISPAKAGMSQGTHMFNYQILLFSYGVSWRYNKIMGLNRWYSELVNLRKMTREYQVVFIFCTGVETINRYVQPLNIVVLAIKASQNQNFDQEHYDEFRAFSMALAKPYPYSKAVHIPCQNSSGNLENNERPLMMRIRLCDPCQALPCHVLSCPVAHV